MSAAPLIDRERFRDLVREAARPRFRGAVERVSGVVMEAAGVPAAIGELCRIDRGALGPLDAEVVGFRGDRTVLMPLGELAGVAPGQAVHALERSFQVETSNALLGRLLDGFGRPIDNGPPLTDVRARPVRTAAPAPLEREPVREALETGVRAIDGLTTLGKGQRLGIFAGAGVGKSTLLGQITRHTAADVVVVCLVGERGREVREMLEEVLGSDRRDRAVVVAATSDRSPLERMTAPWVAMSIAEHFRDQGLDVLCVVDSITRFALAAREVGLAAGEPPTVRGFPPSFFAAVPRLVERMGRTQRGSITGLLTVLLDGDDQNDPVADTLRGLLDGHIELSRDLARAGHFPAIDVLGSLSRLMPKLTEGQQMREANRVRELLAVWRDGRDLVEIGAYKPGTNARLDDAIARLPVIDAFLRQAEDDSTSFKETREMLTLVAGLANGAGGR
ncbi:MAG: FliI/YscN family ATPase [Planctomycetota bacterium]